MREILFKAKRTDSDTWIEGNLLTFDSRRYIINDIETIYYCPQCDREEAREVWFAVIPETVGQYTGLTDKNGNRIFEGDIVKLRRRRDYGIVKYAIPECHFEYLMQGDGDQLLFDDVDYVEIIGNIHDNADLLGENNAKEQ